MQTAAAGDGVRAADHAQPEIGGKPGIGREQSGTSDFAVIIVGSGPAGLILGNILGVLGVRALLIEKNAETVHEPRAVSIDDESLRTMQSIGLAEEVQAQIVTGYGSHYYSPGGSCFTRVEPTGQPYGYPRRNAFRQPDLERTLKRALARFSVVEARYGVTVRDFTQDPDGVMVEVEGGGGPQQLTCRYLVGCDGAWSMVRQKLGFVLEGTTFDERWLIVDVRNNPNPVKHTKVFCDPRRPCLTLPGPDNTRRWEFKLHPHERDEDFLQTDVVRNLIMSHDADPAAELVRKTVYRFHARVARHWSRGRVLLAGDAVHLTPPFAGQGMNSGVRDVHNLGWKLAAVLNGVAGPGLLETYGRERYEHVWDMVRLALRMGRVFAPKNMLDAFLVQTFFRALRLFPPLGAYVAQMKYKPKPRLRSGFLLADGRSQRDTLVGRLIPQPRVLAPDGPTLLDEVIGNRFALLLRSNDPAAGFARLRQPVWDRLGAVRVALLPENGQTALPGALHAADPHAGPVYLVREIGDGLRESFAEIPACALLLRPDHYVAAVIPLERAAEIAAAVEALLTQTWGETPALQEAAAAREAAPLVA